MEIDSGPVCAIKATTIERSSDGLPPVTLGSIASALFALAVSNSA
jgi:hypothetical protein